MKNGDIKTDDWFINCENHYASDDFQFLATAYAPL